MLTSEITEIMTTDDRQPTTGQIYNPLRYSGANNAYYDTETGLYKMGARYYQPDIGRWLTRDEYLGSQEQPQTKNRYAYVENNPLAKVDPSGFMSIAKAASYSRPGDIILTRYNDPEYEALPGKWKHAMLRVRGKKKSLIAEMQKGLGGNIGLMYQTLKNRNYDRIGVVRVTATAAQKNNAQKKALQYAYMFGSASDYLLYSNYETTDDGLNCSEFVWRAYYMGTNKAIDLATPGYIIKIGNILRPSSFAANSKTKLIQEGVK